MMKITGFVLILVFVFTLQPLIAQDVIDFPYLLRTMGDLSALAKTPSPGFKIFQYSSYDKRSTSPEEPSWYSNADGFGREPIPGFIKTLEKPLKDEPGLYLLADTKGPGAIVRGWSAAMGGTLKVYLDGSDTPLFEGSGYDFHARRSRIFMKKAGLELDCSDAFIQQDSDYLPMPFEKSLRITWQGRLEELHFYHLEIIHYKGDVKVKTFDPINDLVNNKELIQETVSILTDPKCRIQGESFDQSADLKPKDTFKWATPEKPGAITEFSLNLVCANPMEVYRGVLLRMAFDGAHKPQVESPAGDFFGTGPGIHPFNSLPMTVKEDGTMTCRFVMPYKKKAEISLFNCSEEEIKVKLKVNVSPWEWDDSSMYFRAKWRTANLLDLSSGPFDMPFIFVRNQGRFVGAASLITNPTPFPHPYGSWWGEGDEKIFVDNEPFPSFYGTGSEDYYNYSWSRPDLFDHPYCGQPLDSGPGCTGYCTNHRWHVSDSIPFDQVFAFYMEIWHHCASPGLCYACIGYHYAKPGAIDDHRRVQISELKVMPVQGMLPQPGYGSHGGKFYFFEKQGVDVDQGMVGFDATQTAASLGRLITWKAKPGNKLSVKFDVDKEGEYTLYLVAAHWVESGTVKATLDDVPLKVTHLGGAALGKKGHILTLKAKHARRLLNTELGRVSMTAGTHVLCFECVEPGLFGFDYFWIKKH